MYKITRGELQKLKHIENQVMIMGGSSSSSIKYANRVIRDVTGIESCCSKILASSRPDWVVIDYIKSANGPFFVRFFNPALDSIRIDMITVLRTAVIFLEKGQKKKYEEVSKIYRKAVKRVRRMVGNSQEEIYKESIKSLKKFGKYGTRAYFDKDGDYEEEEHDSRSSLKTDMDFLNAIAIKEAELQRSLTDDEVESIYMTMFSAVPESNVDVEPEWADAVETFINENRDALNDAIAAIEAGGDAEEIMKQFYTDHLPTTVKPRPAIVSSAPDIKVKRKEKSVVIMPEEERATVDSLEDIQELYHVIGDAEDVTVVDVTPAEVVDIPDESDPILDALKRSPESVQIEPATTFEMPKVDVDSFDKEDDSPREAIRNRHRNKTGDLSELVDIYNSTMGDAD